VAELLARARREGVQGVSRRLARRASQRLDLPALDFPLLSADIADSTRLTQPPPVPWRHPPQKLTIGWLSTPPGPGSGGHTTMFRMVHALEQAGHRCVLYLYDRHQGSLRRHEQVIRAHWPWVKADVADANQLPGHLDAYVATSWPTAHVLATRAAAAGHRFYFVQDYEPFFYARGSDYALAEDTYRFGFTHIALGEMVAACLRAEVGAASTTVPFGCDTAVYTRTNLGPRRGVVLYAKPTVERRGFRLAQLALQELHRRHPREPVHLYGESVPDLGFPAVLHHRLTPPQLNALYNQVRAGLALSFTNISLVAEEMLASGVVPVVNDSVYSRADLPHPAARFAPATPGGLADALSEILTAGDPVEQSARAASCIRAGGWERAGRAVTAIIERSVYGAGAPSPAAPATPVPSTPG
jgi:hypothetical protein